MSERKIRIPNEQTLIFLKLARIGQAIANQTEIEELDNIASGEIKRFMELNFLNKSILCEYFLQGFIPETKKKFENLPPTRKGLENEPIQEFKTYKIIRRLEY